MREMGWKNSYPPLSRRGALIQATFSQKPRSTAKHHHHHHQLEKAAYDKIKKHRDLYNLLLGDIGFLPLVASTSGRLNADFIRLVYLHATKETKNYLDAIDPVVRSGINTASFHIGQYDTG